MKQLGLDLDAPKMERASAYRSAHFRSHVTVPEAYETESRARRQDGAVLAFFRARPGERFTPSRVHEYFPQWPLTSIRRSLTNLTGRGLLTHHKADRRPGPLGAKESTWSLA